jgi:hypothetical protein
MRAPASIYRSSIAAGSPSSRRFPDFENAFYAENYGISSNVPGVWLFSSTIRNAEVKGARERRPEVTGAWEKIMSLRTSIRRLCIGLAVIGIATSAFAVTERHIQGVITAVDATSMTIQGKHTVTARIDGKTKIHVDGKLAKISDLKVTQSARAEVNLDEAFSDISATR